MRLNYQLGINADF